jgi:phosphoribosylformimino-5-aminoimidazole carboxamide ribotide isomerase
MDILPAIDIRAGRVVRLSQGEAGRETAYAEDPVAQAERFVADGARWIHVVDLDRAFGQGENEATIRAIAGRVGKQVHLEVSGGIRTVAAVEAALEFGARRVVLGTVAVTDPAVIGHAIRAVGVEGIAVGLDARDGKVAIRGWVETSDQKVDDVCRRVLAEGGRTVIYTDVARDGMLTGPDVDGARRLHALGARVIASGGVANLADLVAVRDAGLAGVIVGRALYAGRFSLREALECSK